MCINQCIRTACVSTSVLELHVCVDSILCGEGHVDVGGLGIQDGRVMSVYVFSIQGGCRHVTVSGLNTGWVVSFWCMG